MKLKLIFAAVVLLLAVAGVASALVWNLWYAGSHTPWTEPNEVEKGRQALAAQLGDSIKREAEIEKIYWNQPEKLQVLIAAHQQRQEKLASNSAAGAIVAHDKQAVERLQQRMEAIEAERRARAEAEAEAERQAEEDARQQALADRAAAAQGHTTRP